MLEFQAFLLVLLATGSYSQCGEAQRKCCEGKDIHCFSFGKRLSGVGDNSTKCFCDADCVRLRDCCTDIWSTCSPQHCEVSEWSEWSRCPCGHSKQKRTRKILHKASFGGADCPELQEEQSCYRRSCKRRRHLSPHRRSDMALILPATFGSLRKEKSIRKHYNWNLHSKYATSLKHIPNTSYCAEYEVIHSRKSCLRSYSWAFALRPTARVCVECHPKAMKKHLGFQCKGAGAIERRSQWSAMRVRGCHGTWKLVTKPQGCSCGSGNQDFIFV